MLRRKRFHLSRSSWCDGRLQADPAARKCALQNNLSAPEHLLVYIYGSNIIDKGEEAQNYVKVNQTDLKEI